MGDSLSYLDNLLFSYILLLLALEEHHSLPRGLNKLLVCLFEVQCTLNVNTTILRGASIRDFI